MTDKCTKEIIELHRFFEEWFNAPEREAEVSLDRVEKALDYNFLIISPKGNRSDKQTLLQNLEKAKGSWNGERIAIKNIDVREVADGLCVAVYEEWQGMPGEMNGRLSSAIFRRAEEAPAGVKWVHLHEVWI